MPEPVETAEEQIYVRIFNNLPYQTGEAAMRFDLSEIGLKYIFLVQSEGVGGIQPRLFNNLRQLAASIFFLYVSAAAAEPLARRAG
jgi:hypothetical protein